jgi:hypothetical protein
MARDDLIAAERRNGECYFRIRPFILVDQGGNPNRSMSIECPERSFESQLHAVAKSRVVCGPRRIGVSTSVGFAVDGIGS